MDVGALLVEIYGRVPPLARDAVDGLTAEELRRAPADDTNPIGWLIWHLTRVQDHHIAELLDQSQLWETGEWAASFGLEPDPSNHGYGHSAADVATVQPKSADDVVAYLDAVQARTTAYLAGLDPVELDRIVDRRWDPPVTLGVRLVSIADDSLQHVGQAAYVRGLLRS